MFDGRAYDPSGMEAKRCEGKREAVSMESISTPTYSSTLSGKGALLEETLAVLRQIDYGHNPDEVKAMVG